MDSILQQLSPQAGQIKSHPMEWVNLTISVFSMEGEGIFALIKTTLLITRVIATTITINFT